AQADKLLPRLLPLGFADAFAVLELTTVILFRVFQINTAAARNLLQPSGMNLLGALEIAIALVLAVPQELASVLDRLPQRVLILAPALQTLCPVGGLGELEANGPQPVGVILRLNNGLKKLAPPLTAFLRQPGAKDKTRRACQDRAA